MQITCTSSIDEMRRLRVATDAKFCVLIHLDPGEMPSPFAYIAEATRSLKRGVRNRAVEQAAVEANSLMLAAAQTAQRQGCWGCSPRKLRKALSQAASAAHACFRAASSREDREMIAGTIRSLNFALDATVTSNV